MTTALLTESVQNATRRKRCFPLAIPTKDGRVRVRIAPGFWIEPTCFIPIGIFRLLPLWQQKEFLARPHYFARGHFRVTPEA